MKRIVVVTPANRPGTLAEIAELLAQSLVNITDIEVIDDHIHGVVHLLADPQDKALHLLAEAGFQAACGDLVVIRIEDVPGGLAKIAGRFRDAEINIRSLRYARRDNGWATALLSTDDNGQARELLEDCLVI